MSKNGSNPSSPSLPSSSQQTPAKSRQQQPKVSVALRSMPGRPDDEHDNNPAGVTTQSEGGPSASETRNRQQTKGKKKQGDSAESAPSESWLKRTREKYGTIELENKGSTARDHLALERTFLAWLRTSLAFASIGIAVTQLFRLNSTISPSNPDDTKQIATLRHMGKPLGATFLGVSVIVLFIGMNRYYESQAWLLKGKFPASRGSILLLAAIAALLIISSLVIVLVVEPTTRST